VFGTNPKVVGWLEHGLMKDAILGEGEYYIANHTYRDEHDVLLVIRTILMWARERSILDSCSKQFQVILVELCKTKVDVFLRTFMAYQMTSKDSKIKLQLDITALADLCQETLRKVNSEIYSRDAVLLMIDMLNRIAKDHPSFRRCANTLSTEKK
jgi:hypothetical protein